MVKSGLQILGVNGLEGMFKGEELFIRMKSICIISLFLIFSNCKHETNVPFYPVYFDGKKLIIDYDSKLSETEKANIISVFNYYGIAIKTNKKSQILIPKELSLDTNYLWNITTKSTDNIWFNSKELIYRH